MNELTRALGSLCILSVCACGASHERHLDDAGQPSALDATAPAEDASHDAADGGMLEPQTASDAAAPPLGGDLLAFYIAGYGDLYRSSSAADPLKITDRSAWSTTLPVRVERAAVSLDGSFAVSVISVDHVSSLQPLAVQLSRIHGDSVDTSVLTPALTGERQLQKPTIRVHEGGATLCYATDALGPQDLQYEMFWIEIDAQGQASAPVRLHPGKTSAIEAPDCTLTWNGAALFEANLGDGQQTYWVKLEANPKPVRISNVDGADTGSELMTAGLISDDGRVVLQHVHDQTLPSPAMQLYATELGDSGPGATVQLAPWHQAYQPLAFDSSPDGHLVASVLADQNTIGVHRFAKGVVQNATQLVAPGGVVPPVFDGGTLPMVFDLQVTPSERVVFQRAVDDSTSEVWVVDASGETPSAPALASAAGGRVTVSAQPLDGAQLPYRAPRTDLVPILRNDDAGVVFSLLDVRTMPPKLIDLRTEGPGEVGYTFSDHQCASSVQQCLFTFMNARGKDGCRLYRYDPRAPTPVAALVATNGPILDVCRLDVDDAQRAAAWYAQASTPVFDVRLIDLTTEPPSVGSLRIPTDGEFDRFIALRRTTSP